MKKLNLSSFPWYVFLFAIYPVFTLLAHNIGEVNVNVAYRALIVSLVVAMLMFAVLARVLHDHQKAGLVVALAYLSFFSYGHVYVFVKNFEVGGILIGRHRFLLVVWIVLFALGLWWSLKKSARIPSLTSGLNVMVVGLIILPIYQIGSFAYTTIRNHKSYHPQSIVNLLD